MVLFLLHGWLAAGCGVPLQQWESERELLAADRLADRGHHAEALAEYRRLQSLLPRVDLVRYCAVREGRMLERLESWDAALEAYAVVWRNPVSLYDERAAEALYRSSGILALQGKEGEAEAAREQVILTYPNTVWAGDAFRDMQRRWIDAGEPERQIAWTARFYALLRHTEIADTLLYQAGVTLQEQLDDCPRAIDAFDLVARRFTRSSLVDNAIWRHAACYRSMGREADEVRLLTDFIDGREISLFMGNYDSQFYNPTLMRLAEIHRDNGDHAGEVAIIERFIRTFPLSLRVPELRHRIVEILETQGDVAGMERQARLIMRDHPDSRWGPRAMARVEEARSRR